MNAQDDLLEYYRRELTYLRVQGGDFASRYPKVARRLDLSSAESPDPHIERLIEAVAFLTARVHRDLDREFPAVATSLLDNLCPSLTQPVAAMTVVKMTLDPSQGKVTSGLRVARGTALSTTAQSGETCRMRTAWDLTLWPLRVDQVRLEDTRTVRLDLQCEGGVEARELELESLRLHLGGDLLTTMPLHELLVTGLEQVQLLSAEGACVNLGAQCVVPVGFDEGQEVLAQAAHAHPAQREAQGAARTDARAQLLRFEFPLAPAGAGTSLAPEAARARVYLRLSISPAGKRAPLPWPGNFPVRAPEWSTP